MAPSRENSLSEAHASMLHAFCACNYIHLPLARQHKTSVSVSCFALLRHFQYKLDYNVETLKTLSGKLFWQNVKPLQCFPGSNMKFFKDCCHVTLDCFHADE